MQPCLWQSHHLPGPWTLEGAATHETPHYLLPAGRVTHDFKDYVEPLTQEQMEKLKAPQSE